MSIIYEQVRGAFAFMDAPFGVHPRDHERALVYRDAAMGAGLSWADAADDIRTYAAEQRWSPEKTADQIARARRFLTPHLTG